MYTTQKHLSSCYYTSDLMVNATNVLCAAALPSILVSAGHWQGMYTIVKCTPVGWPSCVPPIPDYDPPFNLRLSQSGSTVTGELTTFWDGTRTDTTTRLGLRRQRAGAQSVRREAAGDRGRDRDPPLDGVERHPDYIGRMRDPSVTSTSAMDRRP